MGPDLCDLATLLPEPLPIRYVGDHPHVDGLLAGSELSLSMVL